MSHTPHELAADFPEHVDLMHQLRESDAHFAKMADSYHTLNRAVHRAESDIEPTSDDHLQQMRRDRVALKDEIYAYLTRNAASA